MEIIVVSIIAVIIVVVLMVLKNKEEKEERMGNMENEENNSTEQAITDEDTRGLMFNTLCNLGCQPENNEDGSLYVQYQGENFVMQFQGPYVRVWDPRWAGIKADDPNLQNIREAVNTANYNFGPTVMLNDSNDNGIVEIDSRYDIMLHQSFPDKEPYIHAVLDSFFRVKNDVKQNFQQLNTTQMEAQRSRRPVGFTTNEESNE